MWDASVDGYARGEGFATVVLKTLSQAIADNDHIECIIRETGVNQDGRTKGITMPSATAQAALIESTYARCGLNLSLVEDRPQYFEAHGTGTPAGDPIEAEAVCRAFFPEGNNPSDQKLYVGSIKTIIGHLEGAAGLAGLLKASLAMRNGIIPPNMHFNQLNPKVQPFYDHLCVPTLPIPWPTLPEGVAKRSSVNSFGFGGTNAHAIIEAWESSMLSQESGSDVHYGPFNLSAYSDQALVATAAALCDTLRNTEKLNLADLGYTLSRRSQFQFQASFSATSQEQLIETLDNAVLKKSFATRAISVTEKLPPRILGVFTGQGAQWTSMGSEIFLNSYLFRKTIQELEESLARLPDAPQWSLSEQLMAPKASSRINEAGIAQPLCTALQIGLVDLLWASGVRFSAVVGHSSGEIAAAYAAGHLSASDAIRIAYYRGVYAPLSKGAHGQPGSMMAVGMSLDEATAFCRVKSFAGRIAVAASNAKSSVTLSGDADAIEEAMALLVEQNTFARLLKVDTAYHSHHMKPCVSPYLDSLRKCNIRSIDRAPLSNWYSSVYGSNGRSIGIDREAIKGQYWVDNMAQAVLFSQAIHRAVTEEHCHDMVLEVGPHPALKGPASETINNLTGRRLPYSGVLKRGASDMNAFSDALGFVWKHFLSPLPLIDFEGFRKSCLGLEKSLPASILKGLPSYSWDHDKVLWKESRKSKTFRTRPDPIHELLGTSVMNGQHDEMRWRNVMKLKELEWLRGHVFQGQVLFPAGGYVAMAFEASTRIAGDQPIRLVELHDLIIKKAITLEDDSPGTEVTFIIRCTDRKLDRIEAEYTCYSGDVDATDQDVESSNFHGKVILTLGTPKTDILPARLEPKLPMEPVDVKRLYSSISQIGLDYSGLFLTDSVRRRLNMSTVTTKRLKGSKLRVHPATLDACFHSIFAAFSWPGDGRLWTFYLPTSIGRVRINMSCPLSHPQLDEGIVADCNVTSGDAKTITGDIDIFCAEHGHPEIQVRALTCTSFSSPGPRDDRRLYAKNVWKRDVSGGIEASASSRVISPSDHSRMAELFERAAYFYLRRLRDQVSYEEVSPDWHMQHLMHWVLDHLLPTVQAGKHPRIKPEWAADTEDLILREMAAFPEQIECELMRAVGDNLPSIVRGDTPALQVLFHNDMLGRLYTDGLGFKQANIDLGVVASQLTHRYPRMNILEIGAGTGGATRNVLQQIGPDQFRSYTYTDISAGFFEKAHNIFSEYSEKMTFRTLNIENDPVGQGFAEQSFDLIIASNVLHATKFIAETMKNCRRLLKPGGYLMLLEITSDALRPQFIVSALPGWFLGIEDGRVWAPTISESQWDKVLRESGFSGVDTIARDTADSDNYCFSVMTSQAMDDRVAVLREPLSPSVSPPRVDDLIIIGGLSEQVADVVNRTRELLGSIVGKATLIPTLDHMQLQGLTVSSGASIICLSDLDSPAFEGMTSQRFQGIHKIFTNAKHILWVTQGARTNSPYANMIVGLGRSILLESRYVRLQFMDLHPEANPDPTMFAEGLLRLVCSDLPEYGGILWSTEHEVAVETNGMYIPRILPSKELNDRLNSDRRIIRESISTDITLFRLTEKKGRFSLLAAEKGPTALTTKNVHIRVEASSLSSFTTSDGQSLFFVVGSVAESGKRVLAVSPTNASTLSVSENETIDWEGIEDSIERLHQLIGSLVTESLYNGVQGKLWVHQPNASLIEPIIEAAKRHDVELFLSTSEPGLDSRLTFIHPYVTNHDFEALIPEDVRTLVNMQQPINTALADLFASSIKATANLRGVHVTVDGQSSVALSYSASALRNLMKQPYTNTIFTHPIHSISISDVSDSAVNLEPTTIVDWSTSPTVSLQLQPLNHFSLFSANKTYLMVGLTGDLGLSICEWMIDHGARHIVVTSRSPKIHPEIFRRLQRRGSVELRAMAVDIANKDEMTKVCDEIRATMPPVGGVANAAMVLRDKSFENMTWEDYEVVLRPKVQGSKILDELFYDTHLDFFIMFSSLACIVGNSGQSNYGAANMFMTSLAYQRRSRGVAASIMHIAMLLGVGYVARSIDQYESTLLQKYKYMAISETGFHDLFAEAILSGRPDSIGAGEVEIITGLSEDSDAPWRENPRFSHYQRQERGLNIEGKQRSGTAVNVREQLAEAETDEEALKVVEDGFSRKLELILQISADKIDRGAPLINLGIDSLVAVEIRSWLLKELDIDMPVLKILSDASLTSLCKDAVMRSKNGGSSQNRDQLGIDSAISRTIIDWEQEIASLCDGLPVTSPTDATDDHSARGAKGNVQTKAGLSVVLTGATGFLGTHFLRRLIDSELVSEIHCVAIRRDSKGNVRQIGLESDKIHQYPGDLSKPLLGLSESDFRKLSATADAIIHNGADVSFLKSYQALRGTNILSTKTLIEMAVSRSVPIHFISTAAVALFTSEKSLPEISAAHLTMPADGDRGYALSKWANEVLLEKVATRCHVPTIIHRAVNIVGEGAPETDLMTALDTYTKILGAVPDLRGNVVDGELDIVDVEEVARGVIDAVLDIHNSAISWEAPSAPPVEFTNSLARSDSNMINLSSGSTSPASESTTNTSVTTNSAEGVLDETLGTLSGKTNVALGNKEAPFSVINYCSDVKVKPQDIGQYMEKRVGTSLEELPFQIWLEKSHDMGMNRLVNFFLQDSLRQGKPISAPCLRKGKI